MLIGCGADVLRVPVLVVVGLWLSDWLYCV